jgi:hypothetical protein
LIADAGTEFHNFSTVHSEVSFGPRLKMAEANYRTFAPRWNPNGFIQFVTYGFYGQRCRTGSGSLSARSGAIFGGAIVSEDRSANKGATIRNASNSRFIRARAISFSLRTSFISLMLWLIWCFAKIS